MIEDPQIEPRSALPYAVGEPMNNSGFGRALAVAFVGSLVLVAVIAMNVRHENGGTPDNRTQSAAAQQKNSVPSAATNSR